MSADTQKVLRTLFDLALSATFMALASAPLVGTAVLPSTFDIAAENRPPTRVGDTAWKTPRELPARLDQAFADRFAFRNALIRMTSLAKIELGVSPSADVIVGRDEWLFYAAYDALSEFRRARPLSPGELRAFRDGFQARHDWLAARGIRYLLAFAPNKETMYPEQMPVDVVRLDAPSRLDQVVGILRDASTVPTIDLRVGLGAARRTERVYHRTDAHWNDLGGFVAYRQMTEQLHTWFPAVTPVGPGAAVRSVRRAPGGDLSGLLGLRDDLPERELLELALPHPRAHETDPRFPFAAGTPPHRRPRAWEVDDPALPRLLVLRDSFMDAVRPFLSEHFQRSVYLSSQDFPVAKIVSEHPDVVVEEVLERFLMSWTPTNPPELERGAGSGMPAARPGDDGAPASRR